MDENVGGFLERILLDGLGRMGTALLMLDTD